MSKHTPGPWKVYENPRTWNDLGRETFPNAEPPAPELLIGTAWDHPQLKGPDLIVTTVHGPYYDPPVTVCITPANARLIAAAPDLLEALREMLAQTRDPEKGAYHEAALQARANAVKALAKVEG